MEKCERCGTYRNNPETCHCSMYKVKHDDYMGDDEVIIWGYTVNEVATIYGKQYNEDGDYALMGDEITIIVIDPTGKEFKMSVGAEQDISYSAREIE